MLLLNSLQNLKQKEIFMNLLIDQSKNSKFAKNEKHSNLNMFNFQSFANSPNESKNKSREKKQYDYTILNQKK